MRSVQRVAFALWGVVVGALSLIGLLLPQVVARTLNSKAMVGLPLVFVQRDAAARLGLALVALVCAWTPKPPRALVWSFIVVMVAGTFARVVMLLTGAINANDLHLYDKLPHLDLAIGFVLLVTQIGRGVIARRSGAGK